jgi:altronate dehydratase
MTFRSQAIRKVMTVWQSVKTFVIQFRQSFSKTVHQTVEAFKRICHAMQAVKRVCQPVQAVKTICQGGGS